MRTPNYKVGWLVPEKVAALTHFHADIRPEDIEGVFSETQQLLETVKETFHILIDNRYAPLTRVFTLVELQQLSPFLKHPCLKNIVIIKPMRLELPEDKLRPEYSGSVCLKNVSTVKEAIDLLYSIVSFTEKDKWDEDFLKIESGG